MSAKAFKQLALEEARQLYQLGLPVQYNDTYLDLINGEERWYEGKLIHKHLGPMEWPTNCTPELSFRVEVE